MEQIISVGNRLIWKNQPCFVIAEAGGNHNGDKILAKRLIDAAKNAGADAVKFQTWRTEDILTKASKKVEYMDDSPESMYDLIKRLELTYEDFRELFVYAKEKGIMFLSTPDEIKSAEFLAELGVAAIKIGSGAITDLRFLKGVAEKRLPVILSTGMSSVEEIEDALEIFRNAGNEEIVLLHCTSNYPTSIRDVNLRAMLTLQSRFNSIVGYSDHTLDMATPIAAVAMGAAVIEKHFTLDKNLEGPDHKASLNPGEFGEMVDNIRRTETILGSHEKKPTAGEIEMKKIIRRSIVAKENIPAGTRINEELITFKIPGTGLQPKEKDKVVGRRAKRGILQDEIINLGDLE